MTHLPNMETLLPLLALWPLLLLALLLWRRSRAWAAALAPWAAVPALLLALYAVLGAALMSPAAASLNLQTAAAPPTLEWPHLLLGLRFGLDATGSIFLLQIGRAHV